VRWTDGYGRMVRAVDLKKYHHRGFEKALGLIPEELRLRRDEVWPAIIRSAELHNALPHTIVHSDPHLGNWYTTVAGTMGLLDWQCLARGHWSRDLAYALSATLTIEDRRVWERDLVALYVDLFAVHSGVTIGFDEAWLRYRQQQFGALSFWTATYAPPAFALSNMQAPATAVEMIRRLSHAIVDLESLDSF
jgi:aminoglycoside phosphotransferase (APT) family kinase protein